MEYIIEQFNIDMRKLDLYIENAENEYMFACEEASLYGDDGDLLMEAGENFGAKLKNFFTSLIQKIKETITKIIEKLKELFTKKKADDIAKTIKSNPELAKKKVKIPDVKRIEDACGKRKLLVKSLVKKAQAGKLTEDELDNAVEKYDKLTKIIKGAGAVVVTAGAAVGLIAFSKHVSNSKSSVNEAEKDIKSLETAAEQEVKLAEKEAKPLVSKKAMGDFRKKLGERADKIAQLREYQSIKGETKRANAYTWASNKLIEDGVDLKNKSGIHRKLARLISAEVIDQTQVDAEISKYTLEELYKISYAAQEFSNNMKNKMSDNYTDIDVQRLNRAVIADRIASKANYKISKIKESS